MKKRIAASLLSTVFLLVACSSSAQPATVIPTLASTANPTLATTVPIDTAPPSSKTLDAVSGLNPEGQPVAEWNGIPIMPDATAGEGDEESYVFTVKATPEQVQEYYQRELGKLGWQSFAQGDGDQSQMLIFSNSASATLTVSVITKGEQALVLLVK